MKKLISLMVVGILCLGMVGCSSSTSTDSSDTKDDVVVELTAVEKIKEKGKVVIGTSADYPPYEYHTMIDGVDTIVGFDIDLAQAIADELGVELDLQDMPFDGLLISLSEGKYDMVIAGLTMDPARQVLFSDAYHSRAQSIIIKKENADQYKAVSDLDGKKIGAQKGTVQEGLAATIAENTTPIALIKFPDVITEVKNGTIDAIIADSDVAVGYVAANDDLMIADIELDYENEGVGIAFNLENQDLCDEVNTILAKLAADGTIEAMMEKAMLGEVLAAE